MTKISIEKLKQLKSWTPSSKIAETLQLSIDKDELKKEISEFEKNGLLERSGIRRGLKFRYTQQASSNVVKVSNKEKKTEKTKKPHDKKNKKEKIPEVIETVIDDSEEDNKETSPAEEEIETNGELGEIESSSSVYKKFKNRDWAKDVSRYIKQKEADKKTFSTIKSFLDNLKMITHLDPIRDPGLMSYTYAIKHTTEGFILKVYSGINICSEMRFTKREFIKYLKQSGIELDD